MVYSFTPACYSTLHDSITSLCKTILPFSFKKQCLPAAEHNWSKLQSDNLKWQQDSFHQMLNLTGLHKEGILSENEVSAFRTHLLDTLIASPPEREHQVILRDKLLFLQELLYAKCISEEEYHSSKRPLLQRLAVQGAEIEARDVIVAGSRGPKENSYEEVIVAGSRGPKENSYEEVIVAGSRGPKENCKEDVIVARSRDPKENSDEEWSVIDLKDEQCMLKKESSNSTNKSKQGSAMNQIKGAATVFSFVSSYKPGKNKIEKSIPSPHLDSAPSNFSTTVSTGNELGCSKGNLFWDLQSKGKENEGRSILMVESGPPPEPMNQSCGPDNADKLKRKPSRTLFHREEREGHGVTESQETAGKSAKKQWGFDGFKKWKKNDSDDETATLPLNERSDSEAYSASNQFATMPLGEGPDTKLIKSKLHSDGSPSDFFIDKVLGEKIKKELSRIQTELSSTNPSLKFSNDQMEVISTKLPVDKDELRNYFPKYGDVVLDVVKKEFKDHVAEMENKRNNSREKHSNSMRWAAFEDNENFHPNHFHQGTAVRSSNINKFAQGQ